MFLATELGIIVGMMCLIPLVFFIKKEAIQTDLKTNAILLLQALFGVFFYRIFTFWGLQYTTAANSGLITSSSPVIVALLAFFFLKERLSRQRILGIFFVVIGLFIINLYPFFNGETDGSTSIKGNVLILLAVFCEALFSIMSKVACKPVSALYRTAIITFYAFLLLLPFSIYDGLYYDWTRINSSSIFCVFYYGVFVSFLSYVLWFKGIERVQASSSAVFTSIVPVSSIILSALVLNDSILFVHIIGLICIISGIFVSAYTHAPT